MANEIEKHKSTAVISAPVQAAMIELDALSEKAQEIALADMGEFERAFKTGAIMVAIRKELTKPGIMDAIMPLAGSALGFKTDRDNGKLPKYSQAELVDPIIEATILRLPCTCNHFNVIARRCYVTKEGMGLKLKRDAPGLGNVMMLFDIPKLTEGGATVNVRITWDYKGNHGDQQMPFAIRVNEGQGADAILGKATRKARAWLFGYLTGSEIPEGEVDDMPANIKNVTPRPSASDPADLLKPVIDATPTAAATAPAADGKKSIAALCDDMRIPVAVATEYLASQGKVLGGDLATLPDPDADAIRANPVAFARAVNAFADSK